MTGWHDGSPVTHPPFLPLFIWSTLALTGPDNDVRPCHISGCDCISRVSPP